MDRISLQARVLLLILPVILPTPASGQERFGLEKRIPWDASRLPGSPEPPLPNTVEKTLTAHSWKSPIDIAPEPSTDRLRAVQASDDGKGSKIVRIPVDPDSAESEVVLNLPKQLTYSVCFHPGYANNGFVYIFNNGPRDGPVRLNRISRYTVGREPPGRVDHDAFVLTFEPRITDTEIENVIGVLRAEAPRSLRPSIDEGAIEGLKFSECLPKELALEMLETRLRDEAGIRLLFAEEVCFTSCGSD